MPHGLSFNHHHHHHHRRLAGKKVYSAADARGYTQIEPSRMPHMRAKNLDQNNKTILTSARARIYLRASAFICG
jgi:hypothetical protein